MVSRVPAGAMRTETSQSSANRVKRGARRWLRTAREQRNPKRGDGRSSPANRGTRAVGPKVIAEVRDLARQHTALAIETLVHIMQHRDKDAARVTAAQAILVRAWGKTVQSLGTEGGVVQVLRITLDEARRPRSADWLSPPPAPSSPQEPLLPLSSQQYWASSREAR